MLLIVFNNFHPTTVYKVYSSNIFLVSFSATTCLCWARSYPFYRPFARPLYMLIWFSAFSMYLHTPVGSDNGRWHPGKWKNASAATLLMPLMLLMVHVRLKLPFAIVIIKTRCIIAKQWPCPGPSSEYPYPLQSELVIRPITWHSPWCLTKKPLDSI